MNILATSLETRQYSAYMKKTHTDPVRAFLAAIGSKGGHAGSRADKVKAARTRWDKAKAQAKADTGHTPSQAQR